MNTWIRIKKTSVVVLSSVALVATGVGVYRALYSPLFLVRVVEIADQSESEPVDSNEIINLAAVPVGQVSLVALDLKAVERRLLTHPWIREVHLQKRFPQTLSISIEYRDAKALMQNSEGALSYVDGDGKSFGRAALNYKPDLPVLAGFGHHENKIPEALKLLDSWEKSELHKISQISSVAWDDERGLRALVTYAHGRTMVDFGQDIDTHIESDFSRLLRVFQYLSVNSLPARQIWADSGKKVVVKTAHGS